MQVKTDIDTGKLDAFEREDFTFTTVESHALEVSLLVPKSNQQFAPNKLPLIVFWHGGGFVAGDRMYLPWWPRWLLELGLTRNAMIASPDYRLLPEATLVDICDDMNAFWTWLVKDFSRTAFDRSWSVLPDLTNILCVGQSAGGSIAVHSALEHPDVHINAVVSLYGPLHMVPELKVSHPRTVGGLWPPPPRQAEAKIRSYISRTKGTIRTTGDPKDMWELVMCIVQQGWMPRLINRNAGGRVDTLAMLHRVRGFPPLWVVHGRDDTVVPAECSIYFVNQIKQILPDVPVLLSLPPGEHNFDVNLDPNDLWIAAGLKFLAKHW